jgi:hypothetical protein
MAVNQIQFFEPTPAKVLKGGTDPTTFTPILPFRPEVCVVSTHARGCSAHRHECVLLPLRRVQGFTKWFKLVVREGDISLEQLLAILHDRYKITVTMIESQLATEKGIGIPLYQGAGNKVGRVQLPVTARPRILCVVLTPCGCGCATIQKRLVTEIAHVKYPDLNVFSPSKSHMLLTLVAQNDDGDDVETPTLAYYWK